MNNVLLYEEYRLVERSEVSINRAWKGAHLLLFFLTFVFGSFCTFCFHMLMYLFDEKCVLFPKLLSLTSLRHNVIYEFMPSNKDLSDLPVDFLSTQWVEKSTCSLPTYVPLVSGIFGLVWTTMFLMCSTGTRTLTGLQRPWRVLPPVFLFSLGMSILCIYSSAVTHYGLQELCVKLGEITGSSTCTYAVNVVTLAYERRIRGVYQATRLTIISAWLHTACWICSALLAIVRVVLAVDFQLVRVKVTLHADVERLMERHETQLQTISADDIQKKDEYATTMGISTEPSDELTVLLKQSSDTSSKYSDSSLFADVSDRINRIMAYQKVPEDEQFIVDIIYDLLDNIRLHDGGMTVLFSNLESLLIDDDEGKEAENLFKTQEHFDLAVSIRDTEALARDIVVDLVDRLDDQLLEVPRPTTTRQLVDSESSLTAVNYIKEYLEKRKFDTTSSKDEEDNLNEDKKKKSNLKNASSQTYDERKRNSQKRVIISEKQSQTASNEGESSSTRKSDTDKQTQTRKKEKED